MARPRRALFASSLGSISRHAREAVADGRVGPAEPAVFHALNGLPDRLYLPMLLFQYPGVLAMPLIVRGPRYPMPSCTGCRAPA